MGGDAADGIRHTAGDAVAVLGKEDRVVAGEALEVPPAAAGEVIRFASPSEVPAELELD